MRDFLLNEALKRLATEAATRFSTMVAGGEEIPFDVAAEGGEESAFYSYVPLTGRYVEEHADELRALPGFAPAREAALEAGVAAPYLEARGELVPADPGERAERMLIVFFAELWEGSTGFALDRERLDERARRRSTPRPRRRRGRRPDRADRRPADVGAAPATAARRAHRPRRLDRGPGRRDAQRGHGPGGLGAAVPGRRRAGSRRGHRRRRCGQLRELISVMRLFKGGGVGLGPYAFAPTGADSWRRSPPAPRRPAPAATASARARPSELAEFASTLESRPDPDGALSWAVGRFEMGCERETALEGLSDHLLALRAVLEGHGPVGASLPMRAAALIGDESMDRIEAREQVEEALQLERAMMNGRPRRAARSSSPAGPRRAPAACCARPPSASSATT